MILTKRTLQRTVTGGELFSGQSSLWPNGDAEPSPLQRPQGISPELRGHGVETAVMEAAVKVVCMAIFLPTYTMEL